MLTEWGHAAAGGASCQVVEMFFHLFQFVAHADKAFHEPCVVVNILLVFAQHLACGGQFEATHLYEVVLLPVVLGFSRGISFSQKRSVHSGTPIISATSFIE